MHAPVFALRNEFLRRSTGCIAHRTLLHTCALRALLTVATGLCDPLYVEPSGDPGFDEL
jgi:hypothetical protein